MSTYYKITSLYDVVNGQPVIKPEFKNICIHIYSDNVVKTLKHSVLINKISITGKLHDPDLCLHCDHNMMIIPELSDIFRLN